MVRFKMLLMHGAREVGTPSAARCGSRLRTERVDKARTQVDNEILDEWGAEGCNCPCMVSPERASCRGGEEGGRPGRNGGRWRSGEELVSVLVLKGKRPMSDDDDGGTTTPQHEDQHQQRRQDQVRYCTTDGPRTGHGR